MGLGSDSQSGAQLTSNINFNPSNIIGSSNAPSSKQTTSQTPSQTQELKDKVGVSLGLGGSGGDVGLGNDAPQAGVSTQIPDGLFNSLPFGLTTPVALGIVAILTGAFILYEKKKKKKKK